MNKISLSVFLVLAFFGNVWGAEGVSQKPSEGITLSSVDVDRMMAENKLSPVDYEYVKSKITDGTVRGAKAVLIDARPLKRFEQGHIPSSLHIPDTQVDKYIGALKNVPKNAEIITYCQGPSCEKSVLLAIELRKRGYENLKVYRGGVPEWEKKNYLNIGFSEAKKMFEENGALFVDARPLKQFREESIQGSLSVPDSKFAEFAGRLPVDKQTKIVVFCSGHNCEKSHTVAAKLAELGYLKAVTYSGGLPEWKEKGMETTAKTKPLSEKESVKQVKKAGFLTLGEDEGSVEPLEFMKLLQNKPENLIIIDLRAKADYDAGHLPGAVNMPTKEFKPVDVATRLQKDKYTVFTCSTGTRSLEMWLDLKDNVKYGGMDKVFYLDAKIECKNKECKIVK